MLFLSPLPHHHPVCDILLPGWTETSAQVHPCGTQCGVSRAVRDHCPLPAASSGLLELSSLALSQPRPARAPFGLFFPLPVQGPLLPPPCSRSPAFLPTRCPSLFKLCSSWGLGAASLCHLLPCVTCFARLQGRHSPSLPESFMGSSSLGLVLMLLSQEETHGILKQGNSRRVQQSPDVQGPGRKQQEGDGAPSLGPRAGAARREAEGTHIPPVSTPSATTWSHQVSFPGPHPTCRTSSKGHPAPSTSAGACSAPRISSTPLQPEASDTLPTLAGPQPESSPPWPPWSQGLVSSSAWVHPAPSRWVR